MVFGLSTFPVPCGSKPYPRHRQRTSRLAVGLTFVFFCSPSTNNRRCGLLVAGLGLNELELVAAFLPPPRAAISARISSSILSRSSASTSSVLLRLQPGFWGAILCLSQSLRSSRPANWLAIHLDGLQQPEFVSCRAATWTKLVSIAAWA